MKTLGQRIFDELGITFTWWENYDPGEECALIFPDDADRISQAVRAAIIEECAKVCDEFAADPDTTDEIARAIRSLK